MPRLYPQKFFLFFFKIEAPNFKNDRESLWIIKTGRNIPSARPEFLIAEEDICM
jgi:hypothetical protein